MAIQHPENYLVHQRIWELLQNGQIGGAAAQEAMRRQVMTNSSSSVLSSQLSGLAKLAGIANGTDTPEQTEGEAVNKLRRSKPDEVKFRDLMVGDKLAWAGREVMVAEASSHRILVKEVQDNDTDRAGEIWSWDMDPSNLNHPLKGSDITLLIAPRTTTKKGGISFDSVILAQHKKEQIVEAVAQVDHHDKIFKQWGFEETFEKGTAISLLFYGPPGTGKTLMAQAIADKYGRKLTMVSTAEIETPEPGGAERNLKKYFAEAEKEGNVLLFDECDSLITDRKRVGMILAAQINALLTELENFKGIVIFTTNRLGTLDPAFDRRLSLKLEFDMPTAKERVLIWKRMFPAKAPLASDIRWEELAEIEIAGGHIKNVILKAARRAAAKGHDKITDEVLWDSLEKEVKSLEDYAGALAGNDQFYGTPMGGGGGIGLSSSAKAKKKMEIIKG